MKTICTSYNKTDKSLVLRNNWIDELGEHNLKDYLMVYYESLDELQYKTEFVLNQLNRRSHSDILEVDSDLDNVVIHIRFVK